MNHLEMERALIKRYRAKLYRPFVEALNDYDLIKDGDKIAVCISGGKDSLVMAKLFQEIKRHGKINFDLEFLVMNPGYNQENLDALINNCKLMDIPIKIKESNIFSVAYDYGGESPCYLCARMRRGFLYDFAKEQGCNKIALGHHFNDVIETTLLNMIYCGEFKTMLPKLKSTNHPGMELIRPMVKVYEKDIINYMAYCEIKAMSCGCKVAEGNVDSKRQEIKELVKELKKKYNIADKCIYKSAENVNLECVIGYKNNGKHHSFLENYDGTSENDEK